LDAGTAGARSGEVWRGESTEGRHADLDLDSRVGVLAAEGSENLRQPAGKVFSRPNP
jgi:hypothetical protein